MPTTDRIEMQNLQEQISDIVKAEEKAERLKQTEDIRNDFIRNLKEAKKHILDISEALGSDFSRKPADFVGSRKDTKDVSEKIIRGLKAIPGVIEETSKNFEKTIPKSIHPIQTRKDFALLKKTINESLEKNKIYIEYWEIIKRRKSLPGFLNRMGRGHTFREFDGTGVNERVNMLVFVLEKFQDLIFGGVKLKLL